MTTLNVGSEYSIVMASNAIYGSTVKGVLAGEVNYQTALAFGSIATWHAMALPDLPKGTSTDPSAYNYYLISDGSPTLKAISEAWISGTPTQVTNLTVVATIQNVNVADILKIQNLLQDNGYTAINVTNVSN